MSDKISTSEGEGTEQERLKSKTENDILTSDNFLHSQLSIPQEDRSDSNESDEKTIPVILASHRDDERVMEMDTDTSLTSATQKDDEREDSCREHSKSDHKDISLPDEDFQCDQGMQSSTQNHDHIENLQETLQNSGKHENDEDELKM